MANEQVYVDNIDDFGLEHQVFINEPSATTDPPPLPVEPPPISLRDAEVTRPEGTNARFFFALAQPHSVDIDVTFDIGSDTPGVGILVPGVDFFWSTGDPLTLTLPAGETGRDPDTGDYQYAFLIQIFDDLTNEVEETHTFTLTAVEATPQAGFVAGDEQNVPVEMGITTLTVPASDVGSGQTAEWDVPSRTVVEGFSQRVDIVLSETIGSALTGDIVSTGQDPSGRLTPPTTFSIAAGETTATVIFTGIENESVNEPQSFTFQLQNLTAGVVAGTLDELVITVEDNPGPPDPEFGWALSQITLGEPGTPAQNSALLTVNITNLQNSPDLSGGRVVAIGTSGGATLNTDYTLSLLNLTFGQNETTKTTLITVLSDALVEGTEIADLTLSMLTGSGSISLGSETLSVSILDEDDVGTGADIVTQFEYPGWCVDSTTSQTVTLRATMNRTFTQDVTVFLEHESDRGIEGTHWEALPDRITIQAGSMTNTATFDVLAAGTATETRWLVTTMYAPTHGQIGDADRHILVASGTGDVDRVPPKPPVPAAVDFEVYNDRVEQLAWTSPGGTVYPAQTYTASTAWGVSTWNEFANAFNSTLISDAIQSRWLVKNASNPGYLQQGDLVVIQIKADLSCPIYLGGSKTQCMVWQGVPAFPTGPRQRIRDLWFTGDTVGLGRRPKIQEISIGNGGTGTGGVVQPDGVDNVHFENLDVVHGYQGSLPQACISTNAGVVHQSGSEWTHGLVRVHNCRMYHVNDDPSGSAYVGSGQNYTNLPKWGCRILARAAYWFSENEWYSSQEHAMYVDQAQGLLIVADNTVVRPNGRTLLQVVSRNEAGPGGGMMSHGLCVVARNTDNDIGAQVIYDPQATNVNGTQALKVEGWFGRCYILKNVHQGTTDVAGINNRGAIGIIPPITSAGANSSGCALFEWPHASGDYWLVLYCEIDDDTYTVTPASNIVGSTKITSINGCYDVSIGEITVSVNTQFNQGVVWFNQDSRAIQPGTQTIDQIGRVVANPPALAENREGGVVWTGAPGPINGSLTAYLFGQVTTPSVEKFEHSNAPGDNGYGFVTAIPVVDSYDGTDPVP